MWDKMKFFLSDIWIFLQPFVKQLLSDSGRILARSAIRAVTIVAQTMTAADGKDKRQAAFDLILMDMKSSGIEIGTSMINAALEAAVINLNSSK